MLFRLSLLPRLSGQCGLGENTQKTPTDLGLLLTFLTSNSQYHSAPLEGSVHVCLIHIDHFYSVVCNVMFKCNLG